MYFPKYHTSRMQRSLKYRGVKISNEIPVEVRISGYVTFEKTMFNFYQKS